MVYARTIGRAGEAGKVLAGDEAIQGGHGLRAAKATAAEMFAAIRALKQAERDSKVPPEERARQESAAQATQRLFRRLGVRRVTAHVVRHDGQVQIALFVPLDVAESLGATRPTAPPPAKHRPRPPARTLATRNATPRHARAG